MHSDAKFNDFFRLCTVGDSAKTLKCVILHNADVNMHKNSLFLALTGLERAKIVFSDTSQQFSHCDLSEGAERCLEVWVICMVMSKKGQK